MALAELAIGTAAGAMISWGINSYFYRRSSATVPEWARPFVDRLPDHPIPVDRMLALYREAVDAGQMVVDPAAGEVGRLHCPNCGTPAREIRTEEKFKWPTNDLVRRLECASCGWQEMWWRFEGDGPESSPPAPTRCPHCHKVGSVHYWQRVDPQKDNAPVETGLWCGDCKWWQWPAVSKK